MSLTSNLMFVDTGLSGRLELLPPNPEQPNMAHQVAKLMLEHAGTFLERTKAIETALYLGMPLQEIEAYLDWLENVRPEQEQQSEGPEGDR